MLSQNVDPMLAGFAGVGVAAPAGGEMPAAPSARSGAFSPLPARAAFGRPFCMGGREALSPHSPNLAAVGFPRPFDVRSSKRHLSRHGRRFVSRRVRGG